MIDPARLRPLDRLRLLEQLAENPALGWLLEDLRAGFQAMALHGDTPEHREVARQKYHAMEDVGAALQGSIAGFRAAHEAEMAAAREAA